MTHTVFIDGAVGTTGLEIVERLSARSEFSLLLLDDAQRKSAEARREAYHSADFAVLCLPDEAAKEAVVLAEGSKVRIIDASSAHRVAPGWAYGFPELFGREAVAEAARVSNPGCYPSGFLALVAPLVHAGLIPPDWPITVNAVSGYSGGGKALIERFEANPDIAFRAYGLGLGHKHLAEMQQHAGLARPPVFSPSVVPAHRGMIVDVPLDLAALPTGASAERIHNTLAYCFEGEPRGPRGTVRVAPLGDTPAEMLLLRDAAPWDGMTLHVFAAPDGSQVRLIARLDNLGKGASGAAVQNLNLMAGLPETAGLAL